jgi:hypothetical protein
MRYPLLAWAVLVLACNAPTAEAADSTKIDRSIGREPVYKSTPKYCLLVFGAKAQDRVWLVLDGDTLYVDRNANGDLTDDGEPVRLAKWVEMTKRHPMYSKESRTKAGDLHVGDLTHEALEVYMYQAPRRVDPTYKDAPSWQDAVDSVWKQTGDGISVLISLDLDCRCYEFLKAGKPKKLTHTSCQWEGVLAFGSSPATAPVLHFGGPLTFRVVQTELQRGKKEEDLTVNLGTAGLGAGTFVAAAIELLPPYMDPRVDIAFPPKREGQPEICQDFLLEDRC